MVGCDGPAGVATGGKTGSGDTEAECPNCTSCCMFSICPSSSADASTSVMAKTERGPLTVEHGGHVHSEFLSCLPAYSSALEERAVARI